MITYTTEDPVATPIPSPTTTSEETGTIGNIQETEKPINQDQTLSAAVGRMDARFELAGVVAAIIAAVL